MHHSSSGLFRGIRVAAFAAAAVLGIAAAEAQESAGPMAAHVGLEIITAFTNGYGPDAESRFEFVAVTPQWVTIDYSSTRGVRAQRVIDSYDRLTSHTYVIGFQNNMPTSLPGTTSLGISEQALLDLRSTGQTPLTIVYDAKLRRMAGVLRTVERGVSIPLLIENQLVPVKAIHATGEFSDGRRGRATGDFYFYDSRYSPLMIQSVIRFSFENQPRTERIVRVSAGNSMRAAMEQALRTVRRYDIYGILFDFNKATLRPESMEIIQDVATMLQNNPLWALQINGYTDSIGGDAYNVELSDRRADAVMGALVGLGINPARLQAQGFGKANPKASNATLQGRAQNRRVELVRTDQ